MSFEDGLLELKNKIDKAIEDYFTEKIALVDNEFLKECYILNKGFLSGGKRLRPIACIKAGGKMNAAISVELLHASTLIHDDIMDEDDVRRNSPSMHKLLTDSYKGNEGDAKIFNKESQKFGVSIAIIQGNILLALAQELVSDNAEAVKILNKAYRDVNEGQALDILFENKDVGEEDYLKMVRLKTGGMFRAAVGLGALYGGKDLDRYSEYASNAAIAFQIHDDLMDIGLGKKGNTFASDIKQGKKNLLTIRAGVNCTNVDDALKLIEESGAVDYCKGKEKEYISKAKEIDDEFFIALADYLIKRKN